MSGDWITDFMRHTNGLPTPEIFRLWSGISALASAMERRLWTQTSHKQTFPNLYILLVAPPGVGKSVAIVNTDEILHAARDIKIAPKDVTKASLIDSMQKAEKKIPLNGTLFQYSALTVIADEMGVFIPAYDMNFMSVLNELYDNKRIYTETRRTNNLSLEIHNPTLNMLLGTQPGYLASMLPETAWVMGITSRLIMIYSATGPVVDVWAEVERSETLFKQLVDRIRGIGKLFGAFRWDPEAAKSLNEWNKAGCPPAPEHSRLEHYAPRRLMNVIKLCMISSISRNNELVVTMADLERARGWLLEAEYLMPDIFRDMQGKSDGQVIAELHYHLWRLWVKTKKPIHESRLFDFLKNRVPSEKIEKVISIAERSNVLVRTAGTPYYVPKPRHEHGGE